jgi:hypothetical protein
VSPENVSFSGDALAINNVYGGMDDGEGNTTLLDWNSTGTFSDTSNGGVFSTIATGSISGQQITQYAGVGNSMGNAVFGMEVSSVGIMTDAPASNNTRSLVVVTIRGSGTDNDWAVNFYTQFGRWYKGPDQTFFDRKTEVITNLKTYLKEKELKKPLIFITGHSHGAAVGNLPTAG